MKYLTKNYLTKTEQLKIICSAKSSKTDIETLYSKQLSIFIRAVKSTFSEKTNKTLSINYFKKLFDNTISYKIKAIKKMPNCVLSKISNVNKLALGFTTLKELKVLNEYKNKMYKYINNTSRQASIKLNYAQKFLNNNIDFEDYFEEIVSNIIINKNKIEILFDDSTLVIKDYQIIKNEIKKITPFNFDDPKSNLTYLVACELYYNKDYELHFLFTNIDEYENKKHWYLTVKAKEIFLS